MRWPSDSSERKKPWTLLVLGSETAGKGLETQRDLYWLVHASVMAGEDTCHQIRWPDIKFEFSSKDPHHEGNKWTLLGFLPRLTSMSGYNPSKQNKQIVFFKCAY